MLFHLKVNQHPRNNRWNAHRLNRTYTLPILCKYIYVREDIKGTYTKPEIVRLYQDNYSCRVHLQLIHYCLLLKPELPH